MNITKKSKYKSQPAVEQNIIPTPGCVYTGDAGNSEWFTGLLLRHDEDYSIICDARGIERVVISSTLRSMQAND